MWKIEKLMDKPFAVGFSILYSELYIFFVNVRR